MTHPMGPFHVQLTKGLAAVQHGLLRYSIESWDLVSLLVRPILISSSADNTFVVSIHALSWKVLVELSREGTALLPCNILFDE
jgi:hypothetical protein